MGRTRAKFRVGDKDKGWKALLKRIEAAKGAKVRVGVLGTKAATEHDGALSNGDLAFIHEFGAPGAGIPARSFIRAPFDAKRSEYLVQLRKLLKEYYHGRMPLPRALGLIGAQVAADFKANVVSGTGIPPPLAPETIRRKQNIGKRAGNLGRDQAGKFIAGPGGVRALIDTGRMIGSISWSVFTRATGNQEK